MGFIQGNRNFFWTHPFTINEVKEFCFWSISNQGRRTLS